MSSISSALAGVGITFANGVVSTPGTLNAWLKANGVSIFKLKILCGIL
jgi:hypothetical protein